MMSSQKILLAIGILLALALAGCGPFFAPDPTPSPAPTQTPYILIITATPRPTEASTLEAETETDAEVERVTDAEAQAETVTPTPPSTTPAGEDEPAVEEVCLPQMPAGWTRYVIHYGDTLWSISRRGGTTVGRLMAVNCLLSEAIQAGQILYAPPIGAPPAFAVGETNTTVEIPQHEEAEAVVADPMQPAPQPCLDCNPIMEPTEVPQQPAMSPTDTPEAAPSPETEIVTPLPTPTNTPESTDTPEPTNTPPPTNTPRP